MEALLIKKLGRLRRGGGEGLAAVAETRLVRIWGPVKLRCGGALPLDRGECIELGDGFGARESVPSSAGDVRGGTEDSFTMDA